MPARRVNPQPSGGGSGKRKDWQSCVSLGDDELTCVGVILLVL